MKGSYGTFRAMITARKDAEELLYPDTPRAVTPIASSGHRYAYAAADTPTAYKIGVVERGVRGHYVMTNLGSFLSHEAAHARAAELNCNIGIDAAEANLIVCSSMRARR